MHIKFFRFRKMNFEYLEIEQNAANGCFIFFLDFFFRKRYLKKCTNSIKKISQMKKIEEIFEKFKHSEKSTNLFNKNMRNFICLFIKHFFYQFSTLFSDWFVFLIFIPSRRI